MKDDNGDPILMLNVFAQKLKLHIASYGDKTNKPGRLKNLLGELFTMLTNRALSLTRLLRNGERTLREIWELCMADPTNTVEKLGFKKTC
jgi:hypothetical protein